MSGEPQASVAAQSTRATARLRALVVALALMALVLVVVLLRFQPPAPLGTEAPSDEFSAGRAYAILQDLQGPGIPHPVGSAANQGVRERILEHMTDLEYEVQVQETSACRGGQGFSLSCAPVWNVLAQLPGQLEGPAVMLVAHYDSVPAAPGAADDSSSVAAMIEIARILQEDTPHRNPVIFLFTDGEEVGLLGAEGVARQHPWMEDIGVVINLEARGTSGPSLMFETSDGNAGLIDAYAKAVSRPASNSLFYEVYRTLPNDTDLTIFKAAGLPGMNFAYIETSQHYHTALDSLENLHQGSLQHHGDNALALARHLADSELPLVASGNAAYMDLLGFGVLRWPAAWTIPLTLALMVVLAAAAAWLVRQLGMSLGELLWGLLAGLLCIALPILLGLGLTWLIRAISGETAPWFAHPLPTRVVLWAGTLVCTGLVGAGLAQRAGFWGSAMGIWLLWSLLALLLSLTLAGAAILLLVPVAVASLLMAVVIFTGRFQVKPLREAAVILPALVSGAIWFTLAMGFEAATGFELSPAITLSVGLVASTLLPMLAQPRAGLWLAAASAAVTAVALVIAVTVAPYSELKAQPLNLYHMEDGDQGTAVCVTDPLVGSTPAALRSGFDAEPVAVFPWSNSLHLATKCDGTGMPAPGLAILSDQLVGADREVEVELHSPRGAGGIDVFLPGEQVQSITAAGQTFPVALDGGFFQMRCVGTACDGFSLKILLEGTDPVQAIVVDQTSGLPAASAGQLPPRPATTVPAQQGDLTMIMRRIEL